MNAVTAGTFRTSRPSRTLDTYLGRREYFYPERSLYWRTTASEARLQ
jgi:hypothetical protein